MSLQLRNNFSMTAAVFFVRLRLGDYLSTAAAEGSKDSEELCISGSTRMVSWLYSRGVLPWLYGMRRNAFK